MYVIAFVLSVFVAVRGVQLMQRSHSNWLLRILGAVLWLTGGYCAAASMLLVAGLLEAYRC